MSDELTSAVKDVGLNANLRPNSLDIRGQQPNLFPSDAFEFDDPNRNDSPVLSMKEPWTIDVGEIKFTSLEAYTQDMIHTASIIAEANSLSIQNNSGEINLQADVINLIARELNLEGDTINIKADKVSIFNPSDDSETEELSTVLKIEGGDIYFGDYDGDGGMWWDQSANSFKIKGSLEGVDGTFEGAMTAGSININDKFTVDSTGEVVMSGGSVIFQDSTGSETGSITSSGGLDINYIESTGMQINAGIATSGFTIGASGTTLYWDKPYDSGVLGTVYGAMVNASGHKYLFYCPDIASVGGTADLRAWRQS